MGVWAREVAEWSVPCLRGGVWCGIMFGAMLGGFRVLSTVYSVRYGATRALGGGIHWCRTSAPGILLV
jgi:hypothetical protein